MPRYRIVILLDREVSEDEYPALMRMVARQIGMDYFDDSTYQANRMMYWASCPSNGVFVFEEGIGQPLRADSYLGMYANWRDVSQWPKVWVFMGLSPFVFPSVGVCPAA